MIQKISNPTHILIIPDLFGVEDLVVGLLVDAVGDLLVVLVAHTVLVGGLVNLCWRTVSFVALWKMGIGG
jgi:hypothetical protein